MARFESLCDKIEKQISSGVYMPGQPLPPVRKLMEMSKLSSGTVQKCLGELERKGMLARHPKRGFFVPSGNMAPEAKHPHIGILVGSMNTSREAFFQGASVCCEGTDYLVSPFIAGHDPEKYEELFEKLAKCNIAGIIAQLPYNLILSHMEQLTKRKTPMVLWGSEMPGFLVDRISLNFYILGHMIAARIIKRGHKKVKFLSSMDGNPIEFEQLVFGMGEVLNKHDIEFGDQNVYQYEPRRGYGKTFDSFIDSQEFVENMLKDDKDFDVIVCCHEYAAVGAIRAIEQAGFRVPDDIAVISGDHCEYLDPLVNRKITSFNQYADLTGKLAIQMLMQRIEGKRTEFQTQLMSPEIIDGDTD